MPTNYLPVLQLKPYVSYGVTEDDIHSVPKHTAAQLYEELYYDDVIDKLKNKWDFSHSWDSWADAFSNL